jgi:ABC-type uncharacterized transport system permease subunit
MRRCRRLPVDGAGQRFFARHERRPLFAAADAVQARLEGVVLPDIGPVPVQLIQALPYLITVAIVAGFVRTARTARAR